MQFEVLSSVDALTGMHADLFTTIPNDANTPSLPSSSQLSSISNILNKVEENNNKDDNFNLILQLQNDITNLKTSSTKQNNTKRNTPYTIQGNHKRFTTNKYCWTHGACARSSAECKIPCAGHKSDATFQNKQGSSTDFCLPAK